MQGTIRYIDGPGRSSKNISLKRLLISSRTEEVGLWDTYIYTMCAHIYLYIYI